MKKIKINPTNKQLAEKPELGQLYNFSESIIIITSEIPRVNRLNEKLEPKMALPPNLRIKSQQAQCLALDKKAEKYIFVARIAGNTFFFSLAFSRKIKTNKKSRIAA